MGWEWTGGLNRISSTIYVRNLILIYRLNDGFTSFANLLIESMNSSFRRKDAGKKLAGLQRE